MVQSLIDSNTQRQVPFSPQSLRFKVEIKIVFSSSTVPNTQRTQSRFTQEHRRLGKLANTTHISKSLENLISQFENKKVCVYKVYKSRHSCQTKGLTSCGGLKYKRRRHY